jgi:hypothetical protein
MTASACGDDVSEADARHNSVLFHLHAYGFLADALVYLAHGPALEEGFIRLGEEVTIPQ